MWKWTFATWFRLNLDPWFSHINRYFFIINVLRYMFIQHIFYGSSNPHARFSFIREHKIFFVFIRKWITLRRWLCDVFSGIFLHLGNEFKRTNNFHAKFTSDLLNSIAILFAFYTICIRIFNVLSQLRLTRIRKSETLSRILWPMPWDLVTLAVRIM